jgi:long-chain acyl-CoA synthetase
MVCKIIGWLEHPPAGIALIDGAAGRSWTYTELAAAVRSMAVALTSECKALVVCFCRPDAESVVGYLAALAAGHAVMLLDAEADAEVIDGLLDRYRPEFVLRGGHCERRPGAAAGALHEDLAVLLCTSGSTGSPKLVRLSTRNLDANAAQIVEFLEIDSDERAIQTLPIHYSYGLSVLNTHLLARATIVLTLASIVRPEFWKTIVRYECTSFAGVPYTFAMLARIGFERMRVPSLRTLTQAGGRLAHEKVITFAKFMRARGGRLVVMYGQTEATARIAYVPPERLLEKPGSIGIPVPGGRLSLAHDGELIYQGPNVMLGYATERADLARSDVNCGILATGDLATVDRDGYFSIVGRKRRIAKLCGLRINLDELETLLVGETRVAALEIDEKLVILWEAATEPAAADLARKVGRRLALPTSFIEVREVDQIPVTSAGKTDYARITRELSMRS